MYNYYAILGQATIHHMKFMNIYTCAEVCSNSIVIKRAAVVEVFNNH